MGAIAFFGGVIGGFVCGSFAGILAVLSAKKGESKIGQFMKLFFITGFISTVIIFFIILSLYAANYP